MNRKAFLQSLAAAPIAAASITNLIHLFEGETEASVSPKGKSKGCVALAFGDVRASKDLPMRPVSIKLVTDGTSVYFNWPSSSGEARVYADFSTKGQVVPELIVFRLREGNPEPPYYPRWRRGNYWLYTPPGALVKRARYLIERGEEGLMQATSDIRFAALINAAWSGDSKVLEHIMDMDSRLRRGERLTWDNLRLLLTESRETLEGEEQ